MDTRRQQVLDLYRILRMMLGRIQTKITGVMKSESNGLRTAVAVEPTSQELKWLGSLWITLDSASMSAKVWGTL